MLWRKESDASSRPGRGRTVVSWMVRLLVVIAASGLIVFGILWWDERPLIQAEQSLEEGDPKYAHYQVSRFLEEHPDHQRAMALQARVYIALGNPEPAIGLFDQAGADTAEDLHAWARALLMTEQWSLALPLLERVVQMDPRNADGWYELTACRVRLGMFEQALESAQRYATLPDQHARGHVFIGAILRDLGRNEEALAAYQTVLQYDPTAESLQTSAADFLLQYGQTLMRLGKPEEALEPLKRSAATGESAEAMFELGNAAMQLGRPEDAKLAWQRALVLNEQHVQVRQALARAVLQEGKAQEALDWLSPLPEAQLDLATAFLRQRAFTLLGKDEEAQQWQQVAAKLREKQEFNAEIQNLLHDAPQSFWARLVRAHRFAEVGNWRQAELMVNMLIQEAPGEPFVIELASAIHRRRELPSLESLPITHY